MTKFETKLLQTTRHQNGDYFIHFVRWIKRLVDSQKMHIGKR